MIKKVFTYVVALTLLANNISVTTGYAVQNAPVNGQQTTVDQSGNSTVTPNNPEVPAPAGATKVEGDTETPELVIGMSASSAVNVQKDIQTFLVSIGGTGEPVSVQFPDDTKKAENSKLFNSLAVTQMQLYELLYVTGIVEELNEPIKEDSLLPNTPFTELKHYLTAYRAINKFLDTQVETLKSADKQNEYLIEALSLAKIDMTPFEQVSKESPMKLEVIRKHIQDQINKQTSYSISKFITYLNNGAGSDNVDELSTASILDATKDTLTMIHQWKDLPHIPNATDDLKLSGITTTNQEWLTALQPIFETIETDTGGSTDAGAADSKSNTNPELATSVLGRMGSSLFTVKRSANADDDLNKPLTNTLGWVIETELKKSSNKHDPGPAAKDNFLAMFASTAVYTPFISKVGDKDYIEAFKSLYNNKPAPLKDDNELVRFEGNALGPVDILNQVQNLKKPLYYFNDLNALGPNTVYGHSTEDVKGVATLLTVSDLIASIKTKKDLAAITVHGVLAQDGDSWSFYNYTLNKDGSLETDAGTEQAGGSGAKSDAVGVPIANKIHADKTVNGGQDNTRVVFEMTYNDKNPGVGLLTGALMHNIYNDTILKSKFEERSMEAVYIDAIGNIVLNDGVVVLPAAANPTYWAMPNPVRDVLVAEESWTYNPFTVAFMDTYPAIYQSGTAPSSVNEKKDAKKYLLSSYGVDNSFIVAPLKKAFASTFLVSRTAGLYEDFKLDGEIELRDNLVEPMNDAIGVDDKDEIADSPWITYYSGKPLKMNNLSLTGGSSIFPYLTNQFTDVIAQQTFDSGRKDYSSGIYIAKNMYAYIIGETTNEKENVTAANGKSPGGSSVGKLREGFLFTNVTMPVLTGITNSTEFDKSTAKADLLKAGGDTNVALRWLVNATKWMAVTGQSFQNVLSVANSDDIALYKFTYGMMIEYGTYLVFFLIFLLILLFLKENDFLKSALKGAVIASLLFFALFLIPLLVPIVTGFTTNHLTRDTVLTTLMTKMEMTEKVHKVATAGDSGTSVKLYNLSPAQAKEINEQYLSNPGNYLANQFSINDNLGLYVKGTELRLDLYSYWRFNPLIIATSDNVVNPNENTTSPQIYHSDHSTSEYIKDNEQIKTDMANNKELIDYYMPFNLMENGIMTTLNNYLRYYSPPQSIIRYPDGLTKSSYIINTYAKSLAFLSAEPNVAALISTGTEDNDFSHRGITKAEVDLVNQKFYPYGDIMNLQPWVESEWNELPQDYANSMWAQAMIKADFYEPNEGIYKRMELANKVNRRAYEVILQMKDSKGLISDETMIKLIALYATFEFNKEISHMNYNLYPKTASLNEISVADIISSTVLGQSRQFMFYDISVVSNVYATEGIAGAIALILAFAAMIFYSIILSWVLPAMLIVLTVFSIYLVLYDKSIMPLLMFTAKMLLIVLAANLALITVINIYSFHNNLYLFTLMLIAVLVLFLWLTKIMLKKKDNVSDSWQMRTMRGSYGYRGGDEGNENRGNRSGGMRDYLEESEGAYGRGTNPNHY